jgi:hypothetical protein
MFCIIYRSIADPILEQSDILDVLEQSKNFNRINDITGCLLYYDHEFVQYLEGNKLIVTALFEKIKKDKRHKNVLLLFSGHIYSREFENWSMAYENFIGPNPSLAYLKLLVSSYFDNENIYKHLNPATKKFWVVVKTLLSTQAVEKFK